MSDSRPSELAQAVLDNLAGHDTVSIGGIKYLRLQPLRPDKVDPIVQSAIFAVKSELPREVLDKIDEFEPSAGVDKISRQAEGITALVSREPASFDVDRAWEMFVQMVCELPHDGSKLVKLEVPKGTDHDFQSIQVTSSSAGLAPFLNAGSVQGNKKEMHNGHTIMELRDANAFVQDGRFPNLLPYKPALKSEVLKKGKKVRTIMVESLANFLVHKLVYSHYVTHSKQFFKGHAIGLTTAHGGLNTIFASWFVIWLKYHDGDWNDFVDWLETKTFSESDKSNWEASTGPTDGFVSLLKKVLLIPRAANDKRGLYALIARALADLYLPHIVVDGSVAFLAPWKIPSGSYWTATENTDRHKMMVDNVCLFLERHMAWGCANCTCLGCNELRGSQGFGSQITQEDLDYLRASWVMGDDFIGLVDYPVLFDKLVDRFFGTTTTSEVKTLSTVEFLRKRFIVIRDLPPTYQIQHYRESPRVLAKLFMGRARRNVSAFLAAIHSAVWDAGRNEELHAVLRSLYYKLVDHAEPDCFAEEMKAVEARHSLAADIPHTYLPTIHDVVNMTSGIARPLIEYKFHEAAFKKYCMTKQDVERAF